MAKKMSFEDVMSFLEKKKISSYEQYHIAIKKSKLNLPYYITDDKGRFFVFSNNDINNNDNKNEIKTDSNIVSFSEFKDICIDMNISNIDKYIEFTSTHPQIAKHLPSHPKVYSEFKGFWQTIMYNGQEFNEIINKNNISSYAKYIEFRKRTKDKRLPQVPERFFSGVKWIDNRINKVSEQKNEGVSNNNKVVYKGKNPMMPPKYFRRMIVVHNLKTIDDVNSFILKNNSRKHRRYDIPLNVEKYYGLKF